VNWHELAPYLATVPGALALLFVPILERRSKDRAAKAQERAAEAKFKASEAAHGAAQAAAESAKAEMRSAVADEREQASADWARFVDAQDKEIRRLNGQISKHSERISASEIRAEADRMARMSAESNFRKAVIYIRQLIDWISDQLPGANYPPLPPELDIEL
jgi:hypothetical protein